MADKNPEKTSGEAGEGKSNDERKEKSRHRKQ